MYLPAAFKKSDREALLELASRYPLATLVTGDSKGPFVSHVPLLAETAPNGALRLRGHLARANPHWRALDGAPALAIFHGPNTYVSPSWYADPLNVPTWNYAVVHVRGRCRLIETFEDIEELLRATVEVMESREPRPWRYELPEEFRRELVRAIVGIELEVESLDGKYKLSQNRDPRDREGVLAGLADRPDEASRLVLELILKAEKP